MPWQLIFSTIPVIILLVSLLRFELKAYRALKEKEREERVLLTHLVKRVQQKHKEKFGRPCTELDREFPELP